MKNTEPEMVGSTLEAGLAFERRFGSTPCGWRRRLGPQAVLYTKKGLRVTATLAPADGQGRCAFSLRVSCMGTDRGHPEVDELFEIRSAFVPAEVPVRLTWVSQAGVRVPCLVGRVEAVENLAATGEMGRRAG